jgi:hypothetical protein
MYRLICSGLSTVSIIVMFAGGRRRSRSERQEGFSRLHGLDVSTGKPYLVPTILEKCTGPYRIVYKKCRRFGSTWVIANYYTYGRSEIGTVLEKNLH